MIKINPVIRTALFILIIVVISVLAVFSMTNKIKVNAEKIFNDRNALALLEKGNENLLELKNNYNLVNNKLPLIKEVIPDERGLEKVVISLENLALKTNNGQILSFETFDKSKPAGEKIKYLNFSITLSGNINSFMLYLEELKKLPYLIEIKNITIKNGFGIFNNESQMGIEASVYIR